MKILLNGYGRMGREVEEILLQRNHSVAGRIDKSGTGDYGELTSEVLRECSPDAVIEFAGQDCVAGNARICSEARIPVIIGTTGWNDRISEVESIVTRSGSAYLYGSNFAIGTHVFFALVEKAAAMINPLPEYDIFMTETHHNKKVDSPSGTALTTAAKIIEKNNRKKVIVKDALDRRIEDYELHVSSLRGGSVPGTHTVFLDSMADTIEITHTARNRKGLALGAVLAAEWLIGRTGFYTVEDYVKDLLGTKE